MRHYTAREITREGQPTGLWRYTMGYDRPGMPTIPVGYCAEDACTGHATAEEARAHYKAYVIDHTEFLPFPAGGATVYQCAVHGCARNASAHARLHGHDEVEIYHLCKRHANREAMQGWYSVGEVWAS